MKYKVTVLKLYGQDCLTEVQAAALAAMGCGVINENRRYPGVVLILNGWPQDRLRAALGTNNFKYEVRRENDPKLPFRMSLKC